MARWQKKKTDDANKAYGHGIARTNNYGFAVGDNMNEGVSMAHRLIERMTDMDVWRYVAP